MSQSLAIEQPEQYPTFSYQKDDISYLISETIDHHKSPNGPEILDDSPIKLKESTCLATAIYYEARGESHVGKVAVGYVVRNRAKSGVYPKTICGVVKQRSRGVCQFSWFCSIGMKPIPAKFKEEYLRLASNIMSGNLKDPTYGSQYFHTTSMGNIWHKRLKTTIGNHNFY